MKKIQLVTVMILILLGCAPTSKPAKGKTRDYASAIKASLGIFQWDLKDYYFRSTPVGNFGIGTMYLDEKNTSDGKIVENNWLLSHPNIWFEQSLSDNDKDAILKRIFIDGGFGQFTSENSTTSNISAKITLPLVELVDVSAGIDMEKGVRTYVSASQAINRKLVWTEFEDAIVNNKMSRTLTKVYNDNKYVIGAADIVLKGYKVHIDVDKTLNPQLEAKLNSAIGKVIGKDANATLELKKVADGKFEVVAENDVVAAVLFKYPPSAQDRSSGVSEWKTANLQSEEIQKLENHFRSKL